MYILHLALKINAAFSGKDKRVKQLANVPHRYGNACAICDHTVLPVTRQWLHFHLYPSRLKLVLDLATPEGCKAELT